MDRAFERSVFFDSRSERPHVGHMPDSSSRADTTTSEKMTRKRRRTVAGKQSAAAAQPMVEPPRSETDVARRAYLIYLEEGCPEGRHLDHWLRAELELRGQS
jgi:hypothetical protein